MSGFRTLPLERPRLNGDDGSPAASDRAVWWHHCRVEKDMVATDRGEACGACGRYEMELAR